MKKTEATDLTQIYQNRMAELLNEQVNRTITTQVLATGLLNVSVRLLAEILAPMIEPDEKQPENSEGMDLTDISDITLEDKEPEHKNGGITEKTDTEEPGTAGS